MSSSIFHFTVEKQKHRAYVRPSLLSFYVKCLPSFAQGKRETVAARRLFYGLQKALWADLPGERPNETAET
jgi:hypothetical protein